MKKIRALLILTIALLTISCPAAAASQKAAVKKVTNNYLKAVKTFNDKKMAKYTEGETVEDTAEESALFKTIRKYNKRYFSYKIKSVKISGNQTKASVKVSIKYKSLYKAFYKSTLQAMNKSYKLASEKGQEVSEAQLVKDIETALKKNIRKYPAKTKNVRMTIKLVKTDKGWMVDSNAFKSMDPFVCDMMKGLMKAQKDFEK